MKVTVEKCKYKYPRLNSYDICVKTVVSIPQININKTEAEDFFRNKLLLVIKINCYW